MAPEETEAKHTAWVSDHEGSLSPHSRSESEDESTYEPHEVYGVRGKDRELLREEEEREKLLSTGKQDDGWSADLSIQPRSEREGRKLRRSKKNRAGKKDRHNEKKELMYEMEEGGLKDDASSQSSSSSLDLDRTKFKPPMSKVGDG